MAASNRIYSLSLGSQTVRLAEFRSDGRGGLVLQSFRSSELLADPAADATRIGQTSIAVNELAGTSKASGSQVNYAIPSQSVFTRFVKLPSVGEEKVDQIVTFEAQQNVPFPIDEVVWDYQLVPSPDPAQLEVILVAIKSDLLEDLNGAVEGSGLKTNVVDVAPMALYNAFRYNYSDLGGCSLLIDIGARTTNLLFVEGKRVFSRSISIGGNTITAAIAKDFNEPFAAAEERKKRHGFVSLGGTYAEPSDPEVARVSKVIRNTMTRLHAEITRSITFYRSQQGGIQPERVLLCGGAVGMPYMREFFNEKLALPIEFFNPLRNVAVANSVDSAELGREAHLLGELVGLALRSVTGCPMELNLRPVSVVQARAMAARKPYLAAAGVCLLLALGGWCLFLSHAATVQAAVLDSLTPKVNNLKTYEQKFADAEKQIKAKQDAVAPLIEAVEDRSYWVRLLDDLNTRLPSDYIWITSVEIVNPTGSATAPAVANVGSAGAKGAANTAANAPKTAYLLIKGLYLDNPRQASVPDEFFNKLTESSFFAADISKLPKDQVYPVRQTPTGTEWAYPYAFRLPLNKPLLP